MDFTGPIKSMPDTLPVQDNLGSCEWGYLSELAPKNQPPQTIESFDSKPFNLTL